MGLAVVKTGTNEKVTKVDLGDSKVHAATLKSGVAHEDFHCPAGIRFV